MLIFDTLFNVLIIICCISFLAFFLVVLGAKMNGQLGNALDIKQLLNDKIFVSVSAITIFSAIAVFGGGYIFEQVVRDELVSRLKGFRPARDKLIIENKLAHNSKEIIDEVVNLKSITNSRPSGKKVKVIILIDNERTELVLDRVLNDSTVYLVYYPKYKTFRNNSLGQIRTNLLQLLGRTTSTNTVQAPYSATPRP